MPEFTLDFVTPKTTREGEAFKHEQLGIVLQPLRFMEYSLEDVQQTVIFDTNSAGSRGVQRRAALFA